MADHWRQRARLVYDDKVLGEDDRGDLWVPDGNGGWPHRFNAWNPRHWAAYLRSRFGRGVAMIEEGL